ncbi:PTS system mannose/fructose/sorbose family transporter subunit IID [Caldifermentibacillus hisashii]|uniref:PTS system mannose/fructose/sorbose family transporter subunit IID n=1 Tax=Caldifermentibacillus hisashii TaxID=996558 RepID=UPI002E0CECEF|nr:PTS system mannose/fructose/sorbose family transporter subunit IID [Caldifermentibacillus hisashii]
MISDGSTALKEVSTEGRNRVINESKKISRKDLKKVFWRSFAMEWAWNYERQAHMGFMFSMMPILRKLYDDDKEKLAKACSRHMEFFNTTPHLSTLILGISTAMEESNVNEKEFDDTSINGVKAALMGPLAGVGDSFFWGTLRIIATGVGTSLALKGNILGPILFFLIFNVPHVLLRYFCTFWGYYVGTDVLKKIQKSGLMDSLTYGAQVLGLMVIGAMTASMVIVNVPLSIGSGDSATKVQEILDGIMPGLLPLGLTFLLYWLLQKKVKFLYLLLGIAVLGIVGAFFGFLG